MSKLPYYEEQESITGSVESVLATVANRFIGSHPKRGPVYRTYNRNGFKGGEDCRYEMDLHIRWPELVTGQFVYVWGELWSEQETESPFSLSCYCPTKVFINGNQQFASNLNDDVFPDRKAYFRSKLRKGWNDIVLEFAATGTGCGGRFGTGSVKGAPMHFLAPGREGQEGWIYSEPQNQAWTILANEDGSTAEQEQYRWLPEMEWTVEEQAQGRFNRMFGSHPEKLAYAWSKLNNDSPFAKNIVLSGHYRGACTIYMNESPIYESEGDAGKFELSLQLPFGSHDLVVKSRCTSDVWDFNLDVIKPTAGEIKLVKPYPVEGLKDHWLYMGPISNSHAPETSKITRLDALFGNGTEQTFWRVDQPDVWVRPYLENAMYGKWNYPLGVTLYGILQTGLELSDPHYMNYAADHIEQCTSLDEYAHWDCEQYGAPGLNHQLTLIDSLDDCGSFGATMLEAHKVRRLHGAEAAAKRIADYIMLKQDRLPDGALYRTRGTTDFMKDTMWCDDLYMSTPFLSKYYELTGDTRYLDDASMQFLSYKERLFIPELQIMHHVYDYKFDKPNGVAWGRGNGWVLFSLTELLAVMPEEHQLRPVILDFYRELCAGYVALQGQHGLWHQVLTDPQSYEEASCTSMFIYAFARGVRYGWLTDIEPYTSAVLKGWEGLVNRCIDKHGNVYGVCRGSGYSYSSYYYKDELTWQLNDTHGIGIVLLAGIETIKLRKRLSQAETASPSLG
ncbi:MAG: glycoside hydrolase family 105 protein [Candidatus Pristimantibacillus sp.]